MVAIAENASQAPTEAGPAQSELTLVCSVEARLVAPQSKLEISPRGWSKDKFLPPQPASWTWVVTASSPGTVEAVLQLRPVVITSDVNGTVRTDDLGVEEFDVTFSTDQSTTGWISSWWARLVAFATGAAALLGLYLMVRSLRRGKAAPESGSSGQ